MAKCPYMTRCLVSLSLMMLTLSTQAQYTEFINSNRPGHSQGAFAVGKNVAQAEVGPHYGEDKHHLTGAKIKRTGVNYGLRYGVLEELEINLRGEFLNVKRSFERGGEKRSLKYTDFRSNTIGVKYLIYDPGQHYEEAPNLYSWKANQRFKWHRLIPAVSVYAGVNLLSDNRPKPYPFFGDDYSNVSPKVALITQNNWGHFGFVMNFMADRFTEDHKRYSAIFTLTHSFNLRFSAFAEFQTIKDDFYSDEILRFGGAFLFSSNLQFDISGLVNFKDTPRRWQVGVGASYRLNFHGNGPSGNYRTPEKDKTYPFLPKRN